MSDLITDILERYAKAYPHVHPDRAEQQIRQQIGREIMEKEKTETEHGMNNAWDWSYVRSGDIRKICQLEDES